MPLLVLIDKQTIWLDKRLREERGLIIAERDKKK
jgi:hypothetical protein